jgi:hypothetical protein
MTSRDYAFENEPVEVTEVFFFFNYDDSGEMHVSYFETEEEYELFKEVHGSTLEIFSETPRTTTRGMLIEAMERGISLLKLQLQKRKCIQTA